MTNNEQRGCGGPRHTALAAALAALCAGVCGSAGAFEINTANEDLQIHWDNTIRYNFGKRAEAQSQAILGNPNFDDGDRNFKKNSTVTNRVDLLSEFDIVYRDKFGARVSAAGWYDQAYSGNLDNTSLATSNHLDANGNQALGLSDHTKRFHKGPSGEWLDAFVFGSFDLGTMPLSVRAGRHTVYWGESLLDPINGIAFGQAPLDLGKAVSTPGVEAKELFRPVTQLSGTLQATPTLSLAAQYFLKWESNRFPESGSYLMDLDPFLEGGESYILAPGFVATQGKPITPKNTGEWGLAARWSPEWLDGTMGFYARRVSDKMPQFILSFDDPAAPRYFTNYASDIDLYGLSLSKQIAGISFGADLNYRKNMPLNSGAVVVFSDADLPGQGDILGARGKTLHGVFNALYLFKKTPVFDSASLIAELSWTHLLSVTSDPNKVFLGRAGYTDIDRVTKDFVGMGVDFTPKWYQVFPGADLSMPIAYTRGLSGNSAVVGGGNKNAGSYSIGLGLDLYSKYRFDLKYVDYFGNYRTDASGVVENFNGDSAVLKDRGAVYLTFKTTF